MKILYRLDEQNLTRLIAVDEPLIVVAENRRSEALLLLGEKPDRLLMVAVAPGGSHEWAIPPGGSIYLTMRRYRPTVDCP